MKDFDPRKYMELAIDIMRRSIPETRLDGKTPPKVGAILVNMDPATSPDKRVKTAYRGELRQGDHAEYTLLERKNRDCKLDDCVLFATLEPCAPDARKPPKKGCAERIVWARIKKVWVGIEDPDPTVDRKGIKHLQENGIEVEMFDPDLQEVIRAENRQFIEGALIRAAQADEPSQEIILSPLEHRSQNVLLRDLSPTALENYRAAVKIGANIESDDFQKLIADQKIVVRTGTTIVPTGFGLLLFGSRPRDHQPQAGLLATIIYPGGKEEAKDFDGPMVAIPGEALEWLKNKLPNVMNRSQATRSEQWDTLHIALREGIVNALIHRDYSIEEAKCQLIVDPYKIEIRSPGRPIKPITLEKIQAFKASTLSRNPLLHCVFARMKLAEERGMGLRTLRQSFETAGLPLPRYTWDDPYLVLTLYLDRESFMETLPEKIKAQLSFSELSGWGWLTTKGKAKSAEYAAANQVDVRTARRHLSHFAELGLVNSIGAGPTIEYVIK